MVGAPALRGDRAPARVAISTEMTTGSAWGQLGPNGMGQRSYSGQYGGPDRWATADGWQRVFTEDMMTDPRDLTEATDDELRAVDAAARVRIHHTGDSNSAIPEEHVAETPMRDPRDLSRATDDETRAAAAAMSVRVERSAERDAAATTSVASDQHNP